MPEPTRFDVRFEGRVAHLTLAAPPLNILDLALIEALDRELAALPSATQLLVLRGQGGRAFSAGVSIQDHTPDKVDRMLAGFHGVIRRILDLDAIVLAVVDGVCLGGGMELAMACDLVLASEDARFGQPEIQLACYPPVAAALYPQMIGPQRTAELLLTGRNLGAQEAHAWGMVNWLVPRAEVDGKVAGVIADLTAKSAAVTKLTKRAIAAGRSQPWSPALAEAERIYLEELTATKDMHEGIGAFLEKRKPRWAHE